MLRHTSTLFQSLIGDGYMTAEAARSLSDLIRESTDTASAVERVESAMSRMRFDRMVPPAKRVIQLVLDQYRKQEAL